jgi:hypothetical protein
MICIVLLLCLSACSPEDQALFDQIARELGDALADEVGEISKTAVSSAEDLAKTQAAGLKATAQAGLATQVAAIGTQIAGTPPNPWDTAWLPSDQAFVSDQINRILSSTGLENMGEAILENALTYQVNPAFALAMFRKEASFARVGTMAYANKNPGNIIATGDCRGLPAGSTCSGSYGEISTNGRFGVYASMQDGVQAYFMLLNRQYRPGTGYNCRDIACITNIYAPPSENDSQLYIQQITDWTRDYQQRILGQ